MYVSHATYRMQRMSQCLRNSLFGEALKPYALSNFVSTSVGTPFSVVCGVWMSDVVFFFQSA